MTHADHEALVKRLRGIADEAEKYDRISSIKFVVARFREAATALESLAARPQTVTEAIDACAQLRDQSDLDLPPSWEPLFVEGYRHGCDECVSHIQNLTAAPPPTSQWQTMESAPKDGTDILVYCGPVDDPMWAIAHWDDAEPDAERRKVYHMEDCITAGWVLWWTGDMKRHGWPTHWQPLPAPPTEQDKP